MIKRADGMIEHWAEFLEENGLTTGDEGHTHVAAENVDVFQKLSGDTLCDLNYTTLVRVHGEDAIDFLHNQLSNDIQSLQPGQSMLAGYCNVKGRLIGIFRVRLDDGGCLLQLPRELRDVAMERLRKYVLRAKVTFDTEPDQVAFGVCGKTVAKGLRQLVDEVPGRDNALVYGDDLHVTRIPGDGRPRFQLTGPADACRSAWEKLRKHATVMGSWSWARLDILAGIPNLTASTSEAFIPQMVNLDLLGGVNFQKGCYPGQEIVARMHYLGNLKQRMARFRVDSERRPEPGDRVYTQGSASPTGTVVDAQPGAGSGWELLAVVRIADLGRATLCIDQENGPILFQQELPYALPTGS